VQYEEAVELLEKAANSFKLAKMCTRPRQAARRGSEPCGWAACSAAAARAVRLGGLGAAGGRTPAIADSAAVAHACVAACCAARRSRCTAARKTFSRQTF